MGIVKRLGIFKTLVQCIFGCVISSALIGISQPKISIKVSGAFELNDGSGKTRSSFGSATQLEKTKCEMRVVNPFETTPLTVPGNYLCGWVGGSDDGKDALCFDPFECSSLHRLWELYLATGCIYLISYFTYGIVWSLIKYRVLTNRKHASMLYVSIVVLMIGNFAFNKILDKYLMGVFMDDFSNKIRSIVSNNGYPGFSFVGSPVYELQGSRNISQSMFDICSGMIVGLVISAMDHIRAMALKRPRIHKIEMTERFI